MAECKDVKKVRIVLHNGFETEIYLEPKDCNTFESGVHHRCDFLQNALRRVEASGYIATPLIEKRKIVIDAGMVSIMEITDKEQIVYEATND